MMKRININLSLFLVFLFVLSISTLNAKDNVLNQARIYINPGHGGWGPNDRPMATINYAVLDTLGFFETNTNLLKGLSLRDQLEEAGAAYVRMSRTRNGVVAAGDPNRNSNDKHTEGDVLDGVTQLVTLSTISIDAETNNMDYFISIHSNAATDGTSTNFLLLLYRGTDAEPGNGLTEARNMSLDAWKYINKNDVSYRSHYTLPSQNNVRGDISFYGSSSTFNGYTGYLGVLKHGVDGFLSEGCFHTYQPERHRLLNDDYCKQEGVRYARAIRSWFGDTTSKITGDIMGTVKDKYEKLEHNLYKYADNSVDAHLPLNGVTVVLKDADGNVVADYTTDNEYNGLFVFTDLAPAVYTLVFDFPGTDYLPVSSEIEVVANETSFINQLVTDQSTPPPYPFADAYYPTPDQPGDIAAPSSFTFEMEYDLQNVEALQDLTVRRAILRDNKYYVLAVDESKSPSLLVIHPETGDLIKEMSTDGLFTEGYGGKDMFYVLSDIAFTTDGVLIGSNSVVVGKENNAYQNGDFYIYKWEATEGVALEDAEPVMLAKLPTNSSESLAPSGNNNSNYVANSIAVKGNVDDFYIYFDSHAGNDWTSGFKLRLVSWRITDGVVKATQWTDNNKSYNAPVFGPSLRLTYSPWGDVKTEEEHADLHRFVIDGVLTAPKEFKLSWNSNSSVEEASFNGDIPVQANGVNFFRYLDKVYMTTAISQIVDEENKCQVFLFDVTQGLNQAKKMGETEPVLINSSTLDYLSTTGEVNGANISLYLLAGNQVVKFNNTAISNQAIARIYASQLSSTSTNDGYEIKYRLNEDAEQVKLILKDKDSDAVVNTFELTGKSKGENSFILTKANIPEEGEYTWAIEAKAENITKFVKVSDDSAPYNFFGPKGVAIDKSPESPYFGKVYVTNADAGTSNSRTTTKGVYVLAADGSDITQQADVAHAGGISWSSSTGLSPYKLAVANDGRVFVSDYSIDNSGIYYLNPASFEFSNLFEGATRENTYGKLTIGSTYIGGRSGAISISGEGENTKIYTMDRSVAEATTWWKNVNTYKIGENIVWSSSPTTAGRASSYFGNDNASIVATDGGYWGAQFRGAGSENASIPMMFYYDNSENKVLYNTYDNWGKSGSSQNGAMALSEKHKLVALSFNNGAVVFNYSKNANTPILEEKFTSTLNSPATTYDDFEFDYAGNLYAVSYASKKLSVWAMPTDNNSTVTPAQKSMIIKYDIGTSSNDIEYHNLKVYPTVVTDYCTIESDQAIHTIEVYSHTGILIDRITSNLVNSLQLKTAEYTKGVYLLRINGEQTLKIIKN